MYPNYLLVPRNTNMTQMLKNAMRRQIIAGFAVITLGLLGSLHALAQESSTSAATAQKQLLQYLKQGRAVPTQLRQQLLVSPSQATTTVARSNAAAEAQQLAQAHQDFLTIAQAARRSVSGKGSYQASQLEGGNTQLQAAVLLMQNRLAADLVRLQQASASSEHVSRQTKFADDLQAYYQRVQTQAAAVLQTAQGGTLSSASASSLDTLIASLRERATQKSEAPSLRANAVPYGALALGRNQPVTTPAITPSYASTTESAIVDADTQGNNESPLNDEIIAKARALNNDYVQIYEFVRNSVKTEWYPGSVKGAIGTLRTLSGNDVDQASLLIALLRAAGLPARYVTGVAEMPTDQLATRIGLADGTQVPGYLTKAGLAFTSVTRGGKVAAVQIAHTWVSVNVPYTNYRGALVDASGKSWIPLDASYKLGTHQASSGIYSSLGGADALMKQFLSSPSYTTLLALISQGVDAQLQSSGKTGSLASQIATDSITVQSLAILPNSLPYSVTAVTAESPTIAEATKVTLRIVVRQGSATTDTIALDATEPLVLTHNSRLTLSYAPATQEDHRVTLLYGGLDSVPLYLINLRPQLKLDGKVVAAGTQVVAPGKSLRMELYLSGPFGQQEIDQNVLAGAYHAIVSGAQPTRTTADLTDDTEYDGAALIDGIGKLYANQWTDSENTLAGLADVAITRPVPALSIVTNNYTVQYANGLPVNLAWQGVSLDAAFRPVESVGSKAKDFFALSALQGSSLEHTIFEDQFSVQSISADKGLALANQGGIGLLTITTVGDAKLAASNHSDAVKADVESLVRQGYTVTIPATQITYDNWTGSVWRAVQPDTWQTGYFISGQLAGGQTAQSSWSLDFLADALQAINSSSPNVDASAGVRIIKLAASDEQQGKVGEALPVRLSVRVIDKNDNAVVGAKVQFVVSAGDASLLADGGTTATTIVAQTNALGIATAAVQLGTSTSVNPSYVYLSGQSNASTRASSIYIDASTTGTAGMIRIAEPFHALSLPGPIASLVRMDTPVAAASLHASVYGGTLTLKAADKYANPIANTNVNLVISTQPICPATDTTNFLQGELCSAWNSSLVLGSCNGTTKLSLKADTEGLVYGYVILGNDAEGMNVVQAAVPDTKLTGSYKFQSSDSCGSSSSQTYSAWISVGAFDVDAAGNNITATATSSTFPRAMEARVFASQWDYKIVGNAAVFQPYMKLVPADGNVTFELKDGTVMRVTNPQVGVYDATLVTAPTPEFEPLYVSSTGISVNMVSNQSGSAKIGTALIPVARAQFNGIYAVKPVIDQFVSEGAPDGQSVNRIYLDEQGQSIYPLRVNYSIQPDTYTARWASLDLFVGNGLLTTQDNGDTGGLTKSGSFYIPRAVAFDVNKSYDAQLRLNGYTDSTVRSEHKVIPVTQALISYLSPSVSLQQIVDRVNKRVCSKGTAVDYGLIRDAQVSLYYQPVDSDGNLQGSRITVFENKVQTQGTYSYELNPGDIGTGRYVLTLEAVDTSPAAQKETRQAFLKVDFSANNSLPVGHTLIQGVDVRDGRLSVQPQALSASGRGPALHFGVAYSTGLVGHVSRVGANWSGNVDMGLSIDNCGIVRLSAGDAGTVSFVPTSASTYTPEKGYHGTLVANTQDNSFDFYSLDGTRYHYTFFNARVQWKLVTVTDRNGNTLTYSYDTATTTEPLLKSVTSSDGRSLTYSYAAVPVNHQGISGTTDDTEYLLTQVVASGGDTAALTYDKFGNLATYTLNGRQTTFAYDITNADYLAHYRLLSETDANGHSTNYGYKSVSERLSDLNGVSVTLDSPAITTLTTPLGETIGFTYDESTWKTATVKRFNGSTSYEFNDYGSATKVTDPVGITTYTWADQDVLLLGKTDARGVSTTFTYDAYGNTTSETTAGISTLTTFNTAGPQNSRNLPLTHTDRNGKNYSFSYDNKGNLVTETRPEGLTIKHVYASNGDRVQSTDGNGNTTRFEYNGYGLLEKTTKPTGAVFDTVHDTRGRVTETTDGRGNRSFLYYDNQNNLVQVRKPDGNTHEFNYDAVGNKTYEKDENGNVTNWEYNAGNLATSMRRAGITHSYAYDEGGNKTQETDSRGLITNYEYDAVNRLVTRTEPLSKLTRYAYDAIGNLLTETDARGNATAHTYDDFGRRLSTTDGNGKQWLFAYDNNGNKLNETDALGRITRYSYDGLNRLITISQPLGRTTAYAYDFNGNKTGETDANGNITRFAYDAANRLIKRTNALGDSTQFEYDLADNLVRQTDELGNITQFEFDNVNRKILQQDSEGYRTRFAYDGNGNITSQTDANGNITSHSYDAFNRRLSSQDSLGSLGQWGYDEDGNLTSETDPLGNTTTHEYNALNQRTITVHPVNRRERSEYDLLGNRTLFVDPRGAQTSYSYDALNRLKSATYADSGTASIDYDDVGNKLKLTDPLGHSTSTVYDDLNRLTQVTDALGQSVSISYDAQGNKLSETDKRGTVTSYAYDALNRPLRTTKAGITLLSSTYDKAGRVASKTDANGNLVSFDYDRRGLPVQTRAPLSTTSSDSFDAMGDVLTHTDPEGRISKNSYDLRRHPLTQTNPAGETTAFSYDLAGHRLTTTRPKGNKSSASYSAAGTLASIIDARGNTTSYGYNANNQLVSVTDALNHTVSTAYDMMGYRQAINYPDGAAETFSYDKAGNLAKHIDANGLVITYGYDALNRETQRTYSSSADGLKSIATSYDANNNPVGITETLADGTRQTSNTYDAFDRLTRSDDPFGASVRYTYDLNGNRLSLRTQDGRATQYTYDALNRLTNLGAPSGSLTQSYDRSGLPLKQSRGNGVATAYTYDAASRPTVLLTTHDSTVLNRTDYAYDINGNRTLERINRPGGAQSTGFTYNEADQLTSATRSDAQGSHATGWTYDGVGNRTSENQSDTSADGSSTATTTRSYAYNTRNQLTGITQSGAAGAQTIQYAYDGQGNQTQKTLGSTITTYAYDAHDQLIQVSRNGTVLGNYRNNFLGLRIEKEAKDPLNPQGPPVKLHTLWDGEDAILDQDTSAQVVARYDFAGEEPIGLWHAQDGAQSLHADALGSVVLTTDSSGSAKAETLFDAWGNPVVDAGQSANKFGFTGHQMDDESGLVYAKARYYDPETGRFLSQDPAEGDPEAPLSYNAYLYAYGNPEVFTDPTGQIAVLRDIAEGLGDANKWLRAQAAECSLNKVVCGTAGAAIGVTRAFAGLAEGAVRATNVVANITAMAAGTVGLNSEENLNSVGAELDGTIDATKALAHTVGTAEGRQAAADKVFGTVDKMLQGDAGAISDASEFISGFAIGGGTKNATSVVRSEALATARNVERATARAEAVVGRTESKVASATEHVTAESPRSARVEGEVHRTTESVRPAADEGRAPKAERTVCPCCFAAGTLVLTDSGFKPIEDIRVGDQVASKQEQSGEVGFKPVTQLIFNPDQPVYALSLQGQGGLIDVLTVTDNHPFRIETTPAQAGKPAVTEWIESAKLQVGMRVVTEDGKVLRVVSLQALHHSEPTYNFTVADYHTYFVGQNRAWVHNECKCAVGGGAGDAANTGGAVLTYKPTSGVLLQAQEGRTTTILGSYNNDTRAIVSELGNVKSTDLGPRVGGFNVLNTPDNLYVSPQQFWTEYNQPWLSNAINRGDNILMATRPAFDVADVKTGFSVLARPNPVTGKMELSGFGREYLTTRRAGYRYENGVMVK